MLVLVLIVSCYDWTVLKHFTVVFTFYNAAALCQSDTGKGTKQQDDTCALDQVAGCDSI